MMGILRNIKTIVLLLAVLTIVISCKESSKINLAEKENTSVYYFIRHAEKDRSDSTNKNPSLTIQGLERANKWAVFFKDKNGEIHTPIPDSFLDGITRRTVIEIAKSNGIKVNERKIAPAELSNFVGCFLTGTAAEVTPVSCIAENKFKVCETIIDLNESYQALVRKRKAA